MPTNFAQDIGRTHHAAQLIWNGLAESTRQGGESMRSSFASFVHRTFYCNTIFPAQEEWLVEWVAYQDLKERRFHAIKRDLYLLKSWHIDLGVTTNGFGSQLERTLCGLKRTKGVPAAKAKLPITLPLLRAMLKQLPTICTGHNLLVFKAAFALAFACFLRCGELTYDVFDPSRHLSIGSVEFANDKTHAIITLPASKTDPFRQGVKVVAPAVPGEECPVRALTALICNRPHTDPLFHLTRQQSFPRSHFVDTLNQTLKAVGVDPTGFSGHSFRRGAATWAAQSGCSEDEVQVMGRWNSNCSRRYVDRPATYRSDLARKLYSVRDGPLVPPEASWRSF